VVDSFLELRSSKEQSVGVQVIDPQGQRPLSLKESTSAQTFKLTSAGFYELQLANGRHDLIGVNPDRRESNLEVIPEETLALWRGNSGTGNAAQAAAGAAGEEPKQPYRLWWYIMLLVFAAALAESLLADRYLGAQQQEDL
jgi:hypothetical protein